MNAKSEKPKRKQPISLSELDWISDVLRQLLNKNEELREALAKRPGQTVVAEGFRGTEDFFDRAHDFLGNIEKELNRPIYLKTAEKNPVYETKKAPSKKPRKTQE